MFLDPPFFPKRKKAGEETGSFDSLISITLYREPLVSLLHLFKYRHYAFLKEFFSSLMIDHLAAWGLNRDFFDCMVSVPAHPLRLKEREYNQAELLAQKVSEGIGLPLEKDMLCCSRPHRSQTKVLPGQRRENIKGVFSIKKTAKGLKILLLDDVFTTGATLSECSKTLKKHGAACVTALTLTKAA